MGLTLEQLLATKTKEELLDQELLAIRGIGWVRKTGFGEGDLALTGTATVEYDVAIEITTEGALGVAEFQYSLDGGDTYNGVDTAIPAGGQYALPGTGVTLNFSNGPGDDEDSFAVGDIFYFSINIPTLSTTSWHAGSVPLTLLEVDAEGNEDFALGIQNVAKGGFLSTAEADWLDLVLQEQYDLERERGQKAIHTVRLTDTAAGGPHDLAPGSLVAGTATGLRFISMENGTIPLSGYVDIAFEAEKKGTAYNVAVASINVLLTALPGVTASNVDIGGGTSMTQQGVNRETDIEARERATDRWATLGAGAVEDAYEFWAKAASSSVTRVKVKPDPPGTGNVRLIIAGPAGAVSSPVVDEVQAYVEPKAPLGTVVDTESAVNTSIALVATVYVRAGYSAAVLADIGINLPALFYGGTNSIGEEMTGIPISTTAEPQSVYFNEVVEQLQLPAGVRNVTLTVDGGTADVVLADEHVAIMSPAASITIVEV